MSINNYDISRNIYLTLQKIQRVKLTNYRCNKRVIASMLHVDTKLAAELFEVEITPEIVKAAIQSVPEPSLHPYLAEVNRNVFFKKIISLAKEEDLA